MMNRDEALVYNKSLGITPVTYGEECIMVDTILAMKSQFCNACTFDHCGCSVQDSILQVDPNATFDTFGCVNFESSKNILNS